MTPVACLVLVLWAVVAASRWRGQRSPVVPRHRSDRRGWTWPPVVPGRRPRGSALPEAIETVASAVRAGRSLADGFALAAAEAPSPLAGELDALVTSIGRSVPAWVAVERWAASTSEPGASLVAAAVGLADHAGGDTAGALVGVADTLRERRALAREIRALSAQARLSAIIVAVAPIGFAAVAALTDRATARFLLATPAGLVCIATGVGLDLAGWRWMNRITGRVR